MNRTLRTCFGLSAVSLMCALATVSAEAPTPKPIRPKTGLVSSNIRTGERSTVVDTGEDTTAGGEYSSPPIAGSVSRSGTRDWRMVIANNTKDPYSVDVTVRQLNARGDTVKNDYFSYTLKGGEQQTRNVSGAINAVDGKLVLNSWKNLAPPAKEKKESAAGAPEGAPATTN